ncbi:MAG: TIGR02466 family protein [Pseudomonadota bacterium]|nr:TIGR02466 family protein [Pseudomonadota bacterium]
MTTGAGSGAGFGAADITVNRLFCTPLIEVRLPGADALVEALKAAILERRAASPGVRRSNIHGWHSDIEMLDWGGEAAIALARETMQVCGRFTSDVNAAQGRSRYEMGLEMWANVSPAGASNQMHAHPGSFWSASFYVDDGGDTEDGFFVAQDPRFPMIRMVAPDLVFTDENGDKQMSQFRVRPEPGKLVVFPSWLMHAVRPHKGPRERISVAMNVLALPAGAPPEG